VRQRLVNLLRPRSGAAPAELGRRLDDLALMQGTLLSRQLQDRGHLASIQDAEFRVFSQFGDDGIVQYLVRSIGIQPGEQRFVEFGVEDYTEANTRFLLQKDNWSGLVLDASAEHIAALRSRPEYWRHDLLAEEAFIDRDNINELLARNGFDRDLGLLSIDVDGNDYWIWEAMEVAPPLVIVEYNSVFGPQLALSIPYAADFSRFAAHSSGLYWGASLKALAVLGALKGYALVGSNSAGNNAYFVRADRLAALVPLSAEEAYVESRFRDARDEQGQLSFTRGAERRRSIEHLPLVDVETGGTVRLTDEGSV
jgi:hypothetical protein